MTGTTVQSNGLGLAFVKIEGDCIRYSDGVPVERGTYKPSKTRWIEQCYDPDDVVDESKYQEAVAMIDSWGLTEEQLTPIINAILNKYIDPDRGC